MGALARLPFLMYNPAMESMAIALEFRWWPSRKTVVRGLWIIMLILWLAWPNGQPPQDNDDEACNQREITGLARTLTSIDMHDPCVINPTTGSEYTVISPGSSSSGNIRP